MSWSGAGTEAEADDDRNIHILGSVQNIKIARDAIVSLILGSPPGQSLIIIGTHRRVLVHVQVKSDR